MSRIIVLIVAVIGFLACAGSSIFHLADKDFTGAMTWLLAAALNLAVVVFIGANHD